MTTYLIPAAGLGARMKSIDPLTPKPLIKVAGIPMLDLVIHNLDPVETDLVVIVGRQGLGMSSWRPNASLHQNFEYIYFELDELSEGPAHTVQLAMGLIRENEPVVVANSDQYVIGGVHHFVTKLNDMKEGGLLLTMNATGTRWSFVQVEAGLVTKVAEKEEISNEATVGIYGWTSKDLLRLSLAKGLAEEFRVSGELYVAPTFNVMISAGLRVEVLNCGDLENALVGLGTPEDFRSALQNDVFLNEVRKFAP